MPGGICAAIDGSLDQSAVRCAEVVIRALGVARRVSLGGVAKAYFPDRTAEELTSLPAGDAFAVRWEAAVFHGRDMFMGPVTATLRPQVAAPAIPESMVRSVSSPANGPGLSGGSPGFFPALNRNYFMFRLSVPHLGLVLDSADPVSNEAEISAIPPYGSVYELVEPVAFHAVRPRSGPMGRMAGSVTLEECRVKLMELGGLKVDLTLLHEEEDRATFDVVVLNESTEDKVKASWLVWPPPEEPSPGAMGVLPLGREEVRTQITLPRDLFYRPRWLALSLSYPFETDAAQAAEFPSLRNRD